MGEGENQARITVFNESRITNHELRLFRLHKWFEWVCFCIDIWSYLVHHHYIPDRNIEKLRICACRLRRHITPSVFLFCHKFLIIFHKTSPFLNCSFKQFLHSPTRFFLSQSRRVSREECFFAGTGERFIPANPHTLRVKYYFCPARVWSVSRIMFSLTSADSISFFSQRAQRLCERHV